MRLLADLNIAPRTVASLRIAGHDVERVGEILPAGSTDESIVEHARREGRAVLTQDLDLSALIALSRQSAPSLICLRLGSSRVEHVNHRLESVLASVEGGLLAGAIVVIEDRRVRRRNLPIG